MARYAQTTRVGTDRSLSEIERTLTRYGATEFAYFRSATVAVIGFRIHGMLIRMNVPIPNASEFAHTSTGRTRASSSVAGSREQAIKQRWRALALVVKAKLEAIDSKITTVEQEFASFIVLPNGQTVGEWVEPQIEEAYRSGRMPNTLLKALGTGT